MRRGLSAIALALCIGCVGPARSYAVYESRATESAESALSAVETAGSGIDVAVSSEAFAPYVSTLISDAEQTASTAEGHFASIQPPDAASDALRAQLLPLLASATSAIEAARIAARRGDVRGLRAAQGRLSDLTGRLSTFLERHEP